MTTTLITFLGGIPSKKNHKRRIQRGHNVFMVPSAAHEAWEQRELFDLQSANLQTLTPPYSITCTIYPPTRHKADLSNKFESIADVLVKAQILEDDNWFVLQSVTLKLGEVDKKNPRAEVEIISGVTSEVAA